MFILYRLLVSVVFLFILINSDFSMAKTLDISPNFNPIAIKTLKNIGPTDLPEISLRARESGIKPVSLKNVNLKLKEKVNWLTDDQTKIIRENTENGKINGRLVPFVQPGEIYADPYSLLAMKFIVGDDGYYIVMEADDDIVEDITIAEQKLFLNDANIVKLAPGIKAVSLGKKSTTFQGTGFAFYFDEQKKLPGYDKEGKLVEVALKGFIIVDAPSVEVKYSKNSGYKFIFITSQNAQVDVKFHADLEKDVKIPLYEYSIPADGCKVGIGFYLVIGVDGSITFAYAITQNASLKAGLYGDTAYFIPTSFNTVKDFDFKVNADNVSLSANLKGEASILAEVIFEVINKGKIVLDNKIGLLLDVKSNVKGATGDFLSIKGDGFMKVTGKVKIKSFDKSKDLYEYKYPLFSYIKERTSRYSISLTDVCAYTDTIKGQIIEGLHPYADKDVSIKITTSAGEERLINGKTDKNGNFRFSFDLRKGDYVSVKIPGTTNNFSESKEATFPYDQVFIEKVDFIQNVVKGYVNAADGVPKYNGSISVVVERTNNIPIHATENVSIPISYPIKFQAQVINGVFLFSNYDIRPFDKVYAILEKEGFVVSSNKKESEGIDVAIDGRYLQEDDKLSSQNSSVIFSYEGTSAPSIISPYYFVIIDHPYGKKSTETKQIKEFRLNTKPVQGFKQIVSDTGPWEMEIGGYVEQLTTSFEKFKGNFSNTSGNIDYRVIESVTFFTEGKKFEHTNIAKLSDEDRKKSISGYINKDNLFYDKKVFVHKENINTKEPFVNVAPVSIKNFTADVSVNYYNPATNTKPTYSRAFKVSIYNDMQKLDAGGMDPVIIWDKKNKLKTVKYIEFKRDEIDRYDLDDFIHELKDVKFDLKSNLVAVNGVLCYTWEKSLKTNQPTNSKLEVFVAKETNLPVKVIFYDGNLQRIELNFSNWQRVVEKI
ncbi:MAG: outer membrane lipoprotein-sorting protein [Calditerrivibrio sp.]|nr:outer membrane lipoprotein-sorting protein [Calditerrivibrio sp.]